MQTPLIKSLAAAAFAVCLVAGSASAQGKGHDKDKGDDKHQTADKHQAADTHHGDDKHQAQSNQHLGNNDQHHDMGRPVLVTTNNGVYRKVPPGLAKQGGMPPGQAKKYYHPADGIPVMRDVFIHHGYTVVRTQPYGASQYVYYRQANGPVQRAVIVPGTSRLGFQNVPQQLVQEILSRLY